MQSGKTGTALYYAFRMFALGSCEKIFVISGNRDTALHKQWMDNVIKHFTGFMEENTEDSPSMHFQLLQRIYELKDMNILKMVLAEKIKVCFGQHLEKVKSDDLSNSVIIWDESHYGQTKDQSLFNFFSRVGIYKAIKGRNQSLESANIHILSVSATPAAELSSVFYDKDPQDKTIFQLDAGNGYKGIREFHSQNLIKKSIPILKDNESKVKDMLSKYIGQKKYMIIRAQNTRNVNTEQILTDICRDLGIQFKVYDAAHQEMLDDLDNEPTGFTVVQIKGMLRMGKELNKAHICAVAETSQSINTDTCLQGLPGRCCGYHNKNIDIYVPKCFLQVGVPEYINFLEHGTGLSKCMMIQGKRTIVRNEDGRFPIVPIHMRGLDLQIPANKTEARDHAPDVMRSLLENSSLDGKNDPVQMAEVREFIQACLDDDTLLNDHLSTYLITGSNWETQYYDVQKKHKNNVPRKHNNSKTIGICYVACDINRSGDHPQEDAVLDLYKKGDIWVFAYTDTKDPEYQFGPAFFEPNPKTIFMDQSDREFPCGTTGQIATMSDEVTVNPKKFSEELHEMIANSLREGGPRYARSITSNGVNPRLLISKEHYKKADDFSEKDNSYLDIITEMQEKFGIKIQSKRVKGKDGYWAVKEITW